MTERALWYDAPPNEAHRLLEAVCTTLAEQSSPRWQAWHNYERILQDRYWAGAVSRAATAGGPEKRERFAVNRARLHAETYKSKLLKTRVLPMAVVKDGDYFLKARAKLNNLFLEGAFEQYGVYEQDPLWADDCVVAGTYFAHAYVDGDEPVIERVDPFEILLDENDWQYRNGRSIHRQRCFDRGVAIETWPDARAAIEAAPSVPPESYLLREQENPFVDQVLVTYSWHRRSGPKAKDGRFVVWVPGATLEEELEAELDELPFAWGWNSLPRRGMWGHPLMADLYGPQRTHDKWTERIDRAMWLLGVPRILLKGEAAKLAVEKIDNTIGQVLRLVGGGSIESWNAEPLGPTAFQFVKWVEDAMQLMGRTSLLSTQGEVPKNIRAYQALKLLEDTDQEGLREPMRFRDAFFVRVAKLLTNLFDKIGGMRLLVKNKRRALELKYSDVKLAEKQFRWAVMPTAFFAKTAAARVDQAKDLVDMKLLPPDRVANFVDIPDLETESSLITAQHDAIEYRIDKILTEGEDGYMAPHPFLDLALLRTMVGNAIARAEADGAPEDRVDLLVRLGDEAAAIQKQASAAAQPGAPLGAPSAPTNAPIAAPIPGTPNADVQFRDNIGGPTP